MAGREGFEPSNARSKAWCLTSLATAQRSDVPGSYASVVEPVPLNVLNISAERESYARPAHHLIHNVAASLWISVGCSEVSSPAAWICDVMGRVFCCQCRSFPPGRWCIE